MHVEDVGPSVACYALGDVRGVQGVEDIFITRAAGRRRSCRAYSQELIDQRVRASLLIVHTASFQS